MTTIRRRNTKKAGRSGNNTITSDDTADINIVFTPDFVRDISKNLTDVETLSNLSQVSKNFSKAVDFSNKKNRKHLLKEYQEKITREIEHFPYCCLSRAEFITEPIQQTCKIYYTAYSNGVREGLYREEDTFDPDVFTKEGYYVNGKLQGNLIVKAFNTEEDSDSENSDEENSDNEYGSVSKFIKIYHYFYDVGVLKSITGYDTKNNTLFKADLERAKSPENNDDLYYTDFMNDILMQCTRFENFGFYHEDFNSITEYSKNEIVRTIIDGNVVKKEVLDRINRTTLIKTKYKDHKILEISKKLKTSEIKHYIKNNLVFSLTTSKDGIIKGDSAFLKIRTEKKGKSDEEYHSKQDYRDNFQKFSELKGVEKYYENGAKIGEIYYQDYHGYLDDENVISSVNKSYYKKMKVKSFSTYSPDKIQKALTVSSREEGESEPKYEIQIILETTI